MSRTASQDPSEQTMASGAHGPVSSGLLDRLRDASPLVWIFSGFSLSYLLFFLVPVFLSGRKMLVTVVVPEILHLGIDLDQTLIAVHRLFDLGRSPYVGTMLFPPLTYLLFRPLQLVGGLPAYWILSGLTILAYGIATLWFPLKVSKGNGFSPVLALVLASGLVSYGVQFELERGQFNVIAVCLAYLAIWIFHAHHSRRLWAYVLFCLSVQLKLYPFIFVLMLVRDWQDWKNNLRRLALLTLANIALFFSLGPGLFLDFVGAVRLDQAGPETVGVVNHSIHSFIRLAVGAAASHGLLLPGQFAFVAELMFAVIVGLCLLSIILKAARAPRAGVNPDLLLACTLAALLLPGESNDYKLTILAGPVVIFLSSLGQRSRPQTGRIARILAILLFSFAYSSTLYSFTYRPRLLVLQSVFPMLLLMLLAATFVALRSPPSAETAPEGGAAA